MATTALPTPAGDSRELEARLQASKKALDDLAAHLEAKFMTFRDDRRPLESRWLKCYRQYKGTYDPEIQNRLSEDRSKAYPRHTRVKVNQMLSKLMEMLFPRSEKNWALRPSKFPELPQNELNAIIAALQQHMQNGQLTDDMIEQSVQAWAKQRSEAMTDKITDQLARVNYEILVRKVVKSAIMYGLGVLKGPMAESVSQRDWVRDPSTGLFRSRTSMGVEPTFSFVRVWDFYPDLTARNYSSFTDAFERFKFSRHDLVNLTKRKDFRSEAIKTYLREHDRGNYKEQTFEFELRTATPRNPNTTASTDARSYEVRSFRGYLPAKQLQAIGLEISEADMYKDVYAEIWLLGNTVIKVAGNPYKDRDVPFYHTFVLDEDEDTGTIGESLPEVIRDSQMMSCSATRMVLDNASAVCGPIIVVEMDRIDHSRQTDYDVRPFQVYYADTSDVTGTKGDAVKSITVNSHISELLAIDAHARQLMDSEAMIQPVAMGNIQNSEAMRTSGGVSQIMGAANLHPKDIIRSFDNFTESVIKSAYEWNMEFSKDDNIKGDMYPIARGATYLVAKEIRAQILQQLLAQMPETTRQVWVDEGKLLSRVLEAHDLDPEEVLNSPEKAQQILQSMQQEQQQTKLAEASLVNARAEKLKTDAQAQVAKTQRENALSGATIKEILSRAEAHLANANKATSGIRIDAAKTLAGIGNGRQ